MIRVLLQLPACSPASVTLQPAPGDTGKVGILKTVTAASGLALCWQQSLAVKLSSQSRVSRGHSSAPTDFLMGGNGGAHLYGLLYPCISQEDQRCRLQTLANDAHQRNVIVGVCLSKEHLQMHVLTALMSSSGKQHDSRLLLVSAMARNCMEVCRWLPSGSGKEFMEIYQLRIVSSCRRVVKWPVALECQEWLASTNGPWMPRVVGIYQWPLNAKSDCTM